MLSPDEKILYVTNGPVVVAFDVLPDGTVRNQRDFAKLEAGGAGDGVAVDAAGRLYVTSQPGVQVFTPTEIPGTYLNAARGGQRGVLGSGQTHALCHRQPARSALMARRSHAARRQEQRQIDLQDPDARPGIYRTPEITS